MLKVKIGKRFGSLLFGLLVVGLAGPAFAGNVYSWVTEDGTYAFTDDSKRIPAMHRNDAKKRPMGKLTRYERLTPVSSAKSNAYEDRILARRDSLREMTMAAPQGAAVGAVVSQGTAANYTVAVTGGTTRSGRNGVSLKVPLGGSASADSDDPTIIESKRMKPSDSLATRHWTFIKRGDRVVSVIKGERRQRPLSALSESDFDY